MGVSGRGVYRVGVSGRGVYRVGVSGRGVYRVGVSGRGVYRVGVSGRGVVSSRRLRLNAAMREGVRRTRRCAWQPLPWLPGVTAYLCKRRRRTSSAIRADTLRESRGWDDGTGLERWPGSITRGKGGVLRSTDGRYDCTSLRLTK